MYNFLLNKLTVYLQYYTKCLLNPDHISGTLQYLIIYIIHQVDPSVTIQYPTLEDFHSLYYLPLPCYSYIQPLLY